MVVVGERTAEPGSVGRGPALPMVAGTGAVCFAATIVGFAVWWPAGVVLGLVVGSIVVLLVGRAMQRAAMALPADGLHALTGDDDLQQELWLLQARLGDDWQDFGRASVLVTQAQWASVAALQRELRVSFAYAQHLMTLLEREGFVGPSRGTRPRIVRLPRDRVTELERLLG